MSQSQNVLGGELQICGQDPETGYFRNGFCHTDPTDRGLHVICAMVTEEFLSFTLAQGNDLSTPRPEFGFPGLKPGDSWCLCAKRWQEAFAAGVAPPVKLAATHMKALEVVSLDDLKSLALGRH